MKKVLSVIMALVMVLCIVPTVVFAENEYDNALLIELGDRQKETEDDKWYKIKTPKGILQIDFSTNGMYSNVLVMDENGTLLTVKSLSYKSGERMSGGEDKDFIFSSYNSSTQKTTLTARYEVEAQYYYIRITNNDNYSAYPGYSGVTKDLIEADFTITATISDNVKDAQIQYLSLPMKKGDKLKLTAVLTIAGAKVKWVSSKPSVVSVSSNGTLTAKKKGTAVITAICGDYEVKLRIKVS